MLERLHRGVHPRVARDQEHGHVEVAPTDLAQELDPVHARHVDVGEDDLVVVRVDEGERLPPVARGVDLPAGLRQHGAEHVQEIALVVHHQDAAAARRGGPFGVRT